MPPEPPRRTYLRLANLLSQGLFCLASGLVNLALNSIGLLAKALMERNEQRHHEP